MKLHFASSLMACSLLLGGTVVRSRDAGATLVRTRRNFLSPAEVDRIIRGAQNHPNSCNNPDTDAAVRTEQPAQRVARERRDVAGFSWFDADIIHRLMEETTPSSSLYNDLSPIAVLLRSMNETTPVHRDCRVSEEKKPVVEDGDEVGFVFLNDNPKAAFVHGDEEVVPVERGKLVVFAGHVPHHTKILEGTVEIAGPFQLGTSSLLLPALVCGAGAQCANGKPCCFGSGCASGHCEDADCLSEAVTGDCADPTTLLDRFLAIFSQIWGFVVSLFVS